MKVIVVGDLSDQLVDADGESVQGAILQADTSSASGMASLRAAAGMFLDEVDLVPAGGAAIVAGPTDGIARDASLAKVIDEVSTLAHKAPPSSWLWDLHEALLGIQANVELDANA